MPCLFAPSLAFTSRSLSRYRALSLLVLAGALTAGCAVQTTRDGKLHVSIDEAELIGETLQVFPLADGSEGKIRRLGKDYSVKIQQYMRVIPIQNATAVVYVGARPVGDRTVLIIQKAARTCPFTTQIMAIKGADVSGWEFGDCHNAPAITATAAGDAIYFDFTAQGRPVRYTYRDGKLLRGEPWPANGHATASAGSDSAAPLADDMPRYAPPPPIALGAARVAATATPPVATPAKPVPKKAREPKADAPLIFKEQEQKATIRLILDGK